MSFPIQRLLGLEGIRRQEAKQARLWGKRFERPMIVIALLIPLQLYVESLGLIGSSSAYVIDWVIWLFFLAETVVLLSLTKQPIRYLLGNWMNLVVILGGIPILWEVTPLTGVLRSLRLLLLLGLLLRISRSTRRLLAQNHLGSTLVVTALVVVMAGVLIAGIDPNIESPGEGIWWALVTVTTVGYGDVVPVTPAGRLFAAILILGGVILFALLTANISAFLIDRRIDQDDEDLMAKLNETNQRLDRIEQQLLELKNKN